MILVWETGHLIKIDNNWNGTIVWKEWFCQHDQAQKGPRLWKGSFGGHTLVLPGLNGI